MVEWQEHSKKSYSCQRDYYVANVFTVSSFGEWGWNVELVDHEGDHLKLLAESKRPESLFIAKCQAVEVIDKLCEQKFLVW